MKTDIDMKVSHLPEIPREAVKDYEKNSEVMLETVNEKLSSREDITDLIGGNSLDKMLDNHGNHVRFMTNVFKLNDYRLMVRTVSWVYRTYKNHGFSYDYFPVELEAWTQAVNQHLKVENARPIEEVYSFMLDSHQNFIDMAQDLKEPELDIPEEWEVPADDFLDALLAGDYEKSIKVVEESINSQSEVGKFFENVVKPAMYRVGSKWQQGEVSVAEEHLASSTVSRVISTLYSRFITFEESKGKAVVAAVANEFHEIGSRIIADSLELAGWDVDHLGVNAPIPDLVDLLVDKKPFLLGLSLAIPFNVTSAIETIEEVRNRPEIEGIKIIIGGKALNDNPELWKKTGADAFCRNSEEAMNVAGEWWRGRV